MVRKKHCPVGKWAQCATDPEKKGSLRRMLEMPKGETIPKSFLKSIVDTDVGNYAWNPAHVGAKRIKVTPLVKHRATFAYNMRK